MTTATESANSPVAALKDFVYEAIDAAAAAQRDYADVLIADIAGDADTDEGRTRCLDANHMAWEFLEKLLEAAGKAHPERLPVRGYVSLPWPAVAALEDAGVNNLADVVTRFEAGTLEEVPGIGPGMVRRINRDIEMGRELGWLA